MYRYKAVKKSRSGSTVDFQGAEGDFVEVEFYKSGRARAHVLPSPSDYLTIQLVDGAVWWVNSKIVEETFFDAVE
jgi:hypothetical protein